jgi:hypothetical protein
MVEQKSKKTPPIFAEIETGYNSLTRLHLLNYKNHKNLPAVQKFWREDESQEWKPGKAITFPDEAIGDIIEGLQKMQTYIEEEL